MILGIDIGGTNIKLGLVDENKNISKKVSIETPKHKNDLEMISEIISAAKTIYDEVPFNGIGIGSPGELDVKQGVCISAGNLPYKNTPIVKIFEEAFKMPVSLENDAMAAVLGELYAGAGRRYEDFIMITIGTGIGGGIVINGKSYRGRTNLAGEFGHLTIDYNGPKCVCGGNGCFEKYASVTALINQTKKCIEQYPDSLLAQMGNDQVTGRTAFEAMRSGCDVAEKVVNKYIEYITYGIGSILWSFDPQAIIIGGAISNEGNNLLVPLQEKLPPYFKTKIEISGLGNDAGVIGAACHFYEVNQ